MKVVASKLPLVLLVTLALGCSAESPRRGPQEIRAEDAADHVGEDVVVAGRIAEISELPNGTTILNFGAPFPYQVFSVVAFERSLVRFDRRADLRELDIRVRGVVRLYRGRPQIVLDGTAQLYVLDVDDSPTARRQSSR